MIYGETFVFCGRKQKTQIDLGGFIMDQKTKKGFQMPSSYTILMIIIALMAVMTWFVPAGAYQKTDDGAVISGTYEVVASNPQGIYDILLIF